MAKTKNTNVAKKVPSFFTRLDKATRDLPNVSKASSFPDFFFDSGSCIINKIISDRYDGGYPQGRMALLAGPASSGKSFLAGNAIRHALDAGFGAFVVDTENSLDIEWLKSIGVDASNPLFNYKGINSITTATKVISSFFKEYNDTPKEEQIRVLMVIDSIDALQTDTQLEKFTGKGEVHNDMGQHQKLLKQFQTNIMHAIKHLPITVLCVKQPYANLDGYTNKRDPLIITPSLRFAYSQILLVTNKLLKDNTTNKFEGINLEVYGNKSRFSKPYQKCIVEVPYESGMDWYSGVLEAAVAMGVVSKAGSGSWYTFGDQKFQKKSFDDFKIEIYQDLLGKGKAALDYDVPDDDLEDSS